MELQESDARELLIEGKTKRVFALKDGQNVLVISKDRITAGDGVKSHALEGKAKISTRTNCALFSFLNAVGIPTAFVSRVAPTHPEWERAFVALNCQMVPIEWVARRVATGSFLKRNVNVSEGTHFYPPKLETFFKDDANHDPQWSEESIVGAKLNIGGVLITEAHVSQMQALTRLVFEVLERVWQTADHVLVDMKIEFGVSEGRVLVADVIDNDSWRLWPKGEKRLMLDKQVYRDLKEVTEESLKTLKTNFETVAGRTEHLFSEALSLPRVAVGVVLGSVSDMSHANKIRSALEKYGVCDVIIEVTSAHKSTQRTLDVLARLQQSVKAIIAVAGLSNGLGPVISGNCALPVISSPPGDVQSLPLDIWSSLRMPSGMGVTTTLGAENAALAAALVVANESPLVWSRVRTAQTLTSVKFNFI